MSIFLKNTLPADFVEKHAPKLSECPKCMKRSNPNSLRTFIDNYVVNLMKENPPARGKTIRILDIGSGNLKQIATIATSLVDAGYSLELCLVDTHFSDLYLDDIAYSPQGREQLAYTNEILDEFKQLLLILNQQAGNNEAAKLTGIFSSVDSYFHTLQGVAPVRYHYVSQDQIKTKIQSGIKPRYVKLDLQVDTHKRQNAMYRREFEENRASCTGIPPDLVLLIDDITEYYPLAAGPIDYVMAGSDYTFRTEILEPIQQLNTATILGTLKRRGCEEVRVYNSKNNYQPVIVCDGRNITKPALSPLPPMELPEQKESPLKQLIELPPQVNDVHLTVEANDLPLGAVDNCSTALATPTFRGLSAESMDPADQPREVGGRMKCQQTLEQLAKPASSRKNPCMMILGTFITAMGIAAVALALTVLCVTSLGITGGVAILLGLGLFAYGAKSKDSCCLTPIMRGIGSNC